MILLGCHVCLVFWLGTVVCSWGSVYLIHSLNSCLMGQRALLGFVRGLAWIYGAQGIIFIGVGFKGHVELYEQYILWASGPDIL